MLKQEILHLLQQIQQPHLSMGLETLSLSEQTAFLEQLKAFPPALLEEQRSFLQMKHQALPWKAEVKFDKPDLTFLMEGQKKIASGKVACLILAGGQGSRLSSSLPKALVTVTPIRKKSLLQLLCEKTLAASHFYNTPLEIALMTSPLNYTHLQDYLHRHDYFGLLPAQVHLFVQETAPFLNQEGSWFLQAPGKIAEGPDGNGHSLKKLAQSGILQRWNNQGIEMVNILPIENPLADPFDAALIGYHALKSHEATLKAISRPDPLEKLGLIVRKNGHLAVQEYSEVSFPHDAPLGFIGLLCLSLSFIEHVATLSLPWHLAHKQHHNQPIWKFERFLFDILPYTAHSGTLIYPREEIYAPLKNSSGSHSLATVQQALLDFDRRLIGQLTRLPLPDHPFELDPVFYYPTAALKAAWENRSLPLTDYITPLEQ